MKEFLISGLRSGIRGRSFQAVFLLGLALIGVAYLSGSFSPRQPQTVALDVGLSGIRFTLVLLSLFWTQELLAKEIERKAILFSLAYPVPRASLVVGRYLAVVILTAIAALLLGLCLVLATVPAGGGYSQEVDVRLGLPFLAALIGIVLDVAVVAAVATCISALSTVAVMPLVVGMAFAIGGRALGATIDYLVRGADGDEAMIQAFGPLINAIRWILPDLSRLDWREWPMYGLVPDAVTASYSILMAFSYAAVGLILASWIFARREFS